MPTAAYFSYARQNLAEVPDEAEDRVIPADELWSLEEKAHWSGMTGSTF